MVDHVKIIRDRIKANLDRSARLTPEQKESLLASEVGLVVAATDSGQPIYETNPPRAAVPESDSPTEEVSRSPRVFVAWGVPEKKT